MIRADYPLFRRFVVLCACGAIVACAPAPEANTPEPGVFTPTQDGPENAPPDTCWGKTVSPAVVERARQQVLVTPAEVNPDGTIAKPPTYRTEDRQIIVTPRQNSWFETPCPDSITPEFTASLQRALRARGAYGGEITGQMDVGTRAAIQQVQRANGVDSGVLSLETARSLGLIAVDTTEL